MPGGNVSRQAKGYTSCYPIRSNGRRERYTVTTMLRRHALPLFAAPLIPAARAADPARLALIRTRMEEAVNRGAILGSVTLAAQEGKVLHHEATGHLDFAKSKPMAKDSIFQIMSMTKPVTGTVILMLAEEGRLALTDPVEKHLPEFRGLRVISSRSEDGAITLRKPSRAITIRDLLTHTSGLPEYGPPGIGGNDFYQKLDRSLAEAVLLYSQLNLLFEPGAQWQYSNPGIAALGRIVEVLSGQSFEEFLAARIFTPLGMKDTFAFPPADKHSRIADVLMAPPGVEPASAGDRILRKGARYSMPEGGLYSTAADLLAFYQLHLNGGVYNGKRLLSRASVDAMTKWHNLGMTPAAHTPGQGYGLSWAVVKEPLGELLLLPTGSYGHGGAFGTLGMIDPKNNAVLVFLVQRFGMPADTGRSAFVEIAEAALTA